MAREMNLLNQFPLDFCIDVSSKAYRFIVANVSLRSGRFALVQATSSRAISAGSVGHEKAETTNNDSGEPIKRWLKTEHCSDYVIKMCHLDNDIYILSAVCEGIFSPWCVQINTRYEK